MTNMSLKMAVRRKREKNGKPKMKRRRRARRKNVSVTKARRRVTFSRKMNLNSTPVQPRNGVVNVARSPRRKKRILHQLVSFFF